MQTRSQSKQNILEFNIDFDEASRMWNSNKKKLPNGCYKYVCGKVLKNGKFCQNSTNNDKFCGNHK